MFNKDVFKNYYEKYMFVVGILGQLFYYIQGWHIYEQKSSENVSFAAFFLGFASVLSWLIYGIILKNKVLIIANSAAIVGAVYVLVLICLYSN